MASLITVILQIVLVVGALAIILFFIFGRGGSLVIRLLSAGVSLFVFVVIFGLVLGLVDPEGVKARAAETEAAADRDSASSKERPSASSSGLFGCTGAIEKLIEQQTGATKVKCEKKGDIVGVQQWDCRGRDKYGTDDVAFWGNRFEDGHLKVGQGSYR